MPQIDLVTGFLGSGKTTFIKKYAKALIDRGLTVGILENDYGAINIDMVFLNDLVGEKCDVEMIVGGDGILSHSRRFKTKLISMAMTGYDRVIVEPSGIYDTDEFFDALEEDPLCRWYSPGSIIAVVDAGMEEDLSEETQYLLVSQTDCAGRIVLSRCADAAAAGGLPDAPATARCAGAAAAGVSPDAPATACCADTSASGGSPDSSSSDGSLDVPVPGLCPDGAEIKSGTERILSILNKAAERFQSDRRFTESDILEKDWDRLTQEDFDALADSGMLPSCHVKLPIHQKSGYGTLFYYGIKMEEELLREKLSRTFSDPACGKVMRIKGFVRDDHSEKRVQINATPDLIQIQPTIFSQEVLIITGENLDRERIDGIWAGSAEIITPGKTTM